MQLDGEERYKMVTKEELTIYSWPCGGITWRPHSKHFIKRWSYVLQMWLAANIKIYI